MTRPGPRGDAGKAVLLRLSTEEHRTLSEAARSSGLGIGPFMRTISLEIARVIKSDEGDFWRTRAWKKTIESLAPAPRRVASRRKAP